MKLILLTPFSVVYKPYFAENTSNLPFCHHFVTRNALIINECCKMTLVASRLKTSCS